MITIPKHLQWPNMTETDRKFIEVMVKRNRKRMKKEPTFKTKEEATKAAVQCHKKNELSFPSVWKEPDDIGDRFALVHHENRENAANGGYTEVVDRQEIVDISLGRIDEIEEV